VPAISRISAICGALPRMAVAAWMNPAARCWTETTGRSAEASSASRASAQACLKSRLRDHRNEDARSILTSDWLHGDPYEVIADTGDEAVGVVVEAAASGSLVRLGYDNFCCRKWAQ
jgi:hypothetical protein